MSTMSSRFSVADPLPMPVDERVRRLRRWVMIAAVCFFVVVVPILGATGLVEPRDINKLGRYGCLALVAIGIDLIWGFTGILSLCQALFFCLGAYVMAMHLSLGEGGGDVRPEYNDIPAFFYFNNVESLPFFWEPARSFLVTLALVGLVPALVAGVLGYFIFRSRVRGVYFSIITQALAWGAYIAFSNNTLLLGGTNGLTGFRPDFNTELPWIIGLYLASFVTLALVYAGCRFLIQSRFGRLLMAIRDNESRLRFTGYDPVKYKVSIFVLAAILAGIGGALYVPQMGIITPNRMQVAEHILMVIWVAVGGRGHLWGAILGALAINYSYSILTSDAAAVWPFVQGGLFLAVVLFFPDGLAGLWRKSEERLAAGQPAAKAMLVSAPLILLVCWLLVEAMGWMPRFMDWAPSFGVLKDGVALGIKYYLLIGGMVAAVLIDRKLQAGLSATAPAASDDDSDGDAEGAAA